MSRRFERSTITLVCIIVVATLLYAAALISFSGVNKRAIADQNNEYLEDATNRMAANIDAQLQAGYDNIRIVANLLSDVTPEIDVERIRPMVEESVFDFIEFADTEGWDHTVMNTMTFAGDRKYYLDGVKQGNTGMELVYNSRATHETLLMFYSPVRYKDEIIGAVLGVYQAANKITELLTADYFGETSLAYLATPEGRIVASSEGYDPAAENYIETLPEGGKMAVLEESGWQLVQYFPEKATESLAAAFSGYGYALSTALLLLYALVLVSVIIFMRDRHKKHQREMMMALADAERANKAKTTFLNNMSHDIRTPMNAIIGFNQMAIKEVGKDDEAVKDCLEKVRVSSGNLLTIINDILEISRIEAGKVVVARDKGDMLKSFTEVKPMMTQLAKEAGIELEFSFGEIEDRYVICDIPHTNRVLTNLISNAIKYSKKGGWVKVHCEQAGRRDDGRGIYRYTVEDNGIGMSTEFQKEVFEQFSRENTSTVSKIQGTGLGLTMCKNLVELMGGAITFESSKDKGSKFTVLLPFEQQEGKENIVPASELSPAELNFNGKRILLVEDNELNREIAAAILEEYGLKIFFAEDGDIAVEKMKNASAGDYDLVLMDIQMPTIDGYEATRQIRALGTEISKIPIIAMTANAFDEDRQTAFKAGMNDHLAKPIDIDALKDTLGRYLL